MAGIDEVIFGLLEFYYSGHHDNRSWCQVRSPLSMKAGEVNSCPRVLFVLAKRSDSPGGGIVYVYQYIGAGILSI